MDNTYPHLLLLRQMLVTFSSSGNESGPIRGMLYPVMMSVLAYPGILSGTARRSFETHFTVFVAAKQVQPN